VKKKLSSRNSFVPHPYINYAHEYDFSKNSTFKKGHNFKNINLRIMPIVLRCEFLQIVIVLVIGYIKDFAY
jgi:hypothetical protein